MVFIYASSSTSEATNTNFENVSFTISVINTNIKIYGCCNNQMLTCSDSALVQLDINVPEGYYSKLQNTTFLTVTKFMYTANVAFSQLDI